MSEQAPRRMTLEEEMAYEMKPEYDLTNARPNPYAERANRTARAPAHGDRSDTAGVYLVEIAPDLLERFPDSAAVNEGLRAYLRLQAKEAA